MLVLSRKAGERVTLGGGITLTVVSCGAGRVRIGITAAVAVCRSDAKKRSRSVPQPAATAARGRRPSVEAPVLSPQTVYFPQVGV